MQNLNQIKDSDPRIIKTENNRKLSIDGQNRNFPVYSIPLDYLFYNDKNARIATFINKYKNENQLDEFDTSDIEAYNSIIEEFIVNSNPEAIKKTKINIKENTQQIPGIILTDGRIIDGNRRFTCLRQLERENPGKAYRFETVILDDGYENFTKQIKLLELQIQLGAEERIDYSPIDKLVDIYNVIEVDNLLTIEEYAHTTNIKLSKAKELLLEAQYLVEYLEFINRPGDYYYALEMKLDGPLADIVKILKKEKDEDRREKSKLALFAHMFIRPDGDITRYIRSVGSILNNKKEGDAFLDDQLPLVYKTYGMLHPEDVDELISTEKTLIDVSSDEELKKTARLNKEKYENKISIADKRQEPIDLIIKTKNTLEAIDISVIQQLGDDERHKIKGAVKDILEGLKPLLEALDV
jgi:hypothetical protein